jgi:hypothetical protein
MYKVEKEITIPNRSSRYPFADMRVGDSFLVPFNDAKKINNALQAMHGYARRVGVKCTVRTQDDGSIRVWRVG